MSALTNCFNSADFEVMARRRLPAPLYHYIAGGADDEVTQRANTAAFDRYELVPRYLRDVREINMGRTVLGCKLDWPLILAPTGMNRLFHPDGECAVAKETAHHGVGYALSTMGSTSIEDVAAACSGPKIFQLYLLNDDKLNIEMIDRCAAAGYDALCVTVDTVWAGNRERDLRSGLALPPRLTARAFLEFLARPRWCARYFSAARFSLPNISSGSTEDLSTLAAYFASRMERHISWDRVERLIQHWNRPFAIKGLQSVEDARIAASVGSTAAILSNHGGRQLDGTAATMDLLPDMVDAVGDRIEIILDGGIRRGSHVVKALAMGARGCMLGRPYLYALAAFGQEGVARVLKLLHDETERTLGLLGCSSLDELTRDHVRLAGASGELRRASKPATTVPQLKLSHL
jgi:L-lactate dehydrogenase (cytochrome)